LAVALRLAAVSAALLFHGGFCVLVVADRLARAG
jgi:hypothetical protein